MNDRKDNTEIMENTLSLYEVMDYTAECYGLNKALGGFVKHIIDENKNGQCMFDVAKVLDDMTTMMYRHSTDGDPAIADRTIHYEAVKVIMDSYLVQRADYLRQLDSARLN